MSIEVSLFGFGDDRPQTFGRNDRISLRTENGITLNAVLLQAGFKDTHGLSAMVNGKLVPPGEWSSRVIDDGDAVKLLMAIEGG